jgi:DNA polymerase-3 subunit beta
MHIVVEQNSFREAVTQVSKAVSTRTTIPVLTGIKIEVNQEGCILTGSDSDMTIQVTIPACENDKELIKVVKMGSIVLPAKYFTEMIRKAPAESIELELATNNVMKIEADSATFQLNGIDAEEYPQLPQLNENQMFRIPPQLFKAMIRQTAFAAATSESRPQLTGVLFKLDNGQLTMVATDSHRLSRRMAKVEAEQDVQFDQVIVPSRSLSELQRLLEDEETTIEVFISSHQLLVKAGHLLFFSRLLDGTYPDIERIIPTQFKATLTTQTQTLIDALERASLLARDGKHVVKLSYQADCLEIKSTAPEVGQVVEQLHPVHYEGDEIHIAFNAKYMLDALKTIESDQVEIRFTGTLSPFMIKPADMDHLMHLIVPVRT